tara:strand:- start:491 stop:826 length:336 start_codon:yes stop_codon:yes gene_type:complete
MHLNEKQRKDIHQIIEDAKQAEYKGFNTVVADAIAELKKGLKSEEGAYNKIYKKVIKNEHHLVHRYANLNDDKSLSTLAEVFSEKIVKMVDFENLDDFVKKEVYKIIGINA